MRGPGPPGESLKAVEAPVNASHLWLSSWWRAALFDESIRYLDTRLAAENARWPSTRHGASWSRGQPGYQSGRGVVSVTAPGDWLTLCGIAIKIANNDLNPMPPQARRALDHRNDEER